jgi:hypothetical protein
MPSFNRFRNFTLDLATGVHDLGADDLRYLLTNDAPTAGMDDRADLVSELADGNGYPAGGLALTNTTLQEEGTSGITMVITDDLTLTATGAVGPFRYVVLYNNDTTGDRLIGWYDRGSSLTLADGDELVLDANQVTGLLRVGAAS